MTAPRILLRPSHRHESAAGECAVHVARAEGRDCRDDCGHRNTGVDRHLRERAALAPR